MGGSPLPPEMEAWVPPSCAAPFTCGAVAPFAAAAPPEPLSAPAVAAPAEPVPPDPAAAAPEPALATDFEADADLEPPASAEAPAAPELAAPAPAAPAPAAPAFADDLDPVEAGELAGTVSAASTP